VKTTKLFRQKHKNNHKTFQEEIRSQIVIKEKGLFEATKKKPNNLEKLYHALNTIKPTSAVPESFFSNTALLVTKLRNRLNDKSVF